MSLRQRRLRVIFFDAAGTLFHLPKGVGYHYALVARRLGWLLEAAAVDRAFRRVWKSMPPRAAGDGPRADDDRGWWRTVVDRVLEECAAAHIDRDAYFHAVYPHFMEAEVWELYPETRDILQALHGRVSLRIISNFDGRLLQILENLDIARFIDDVVISSAVGADKPDGRIFARALERAGVAADEALHVGDDPVADWEGAEKAGLRSFRLERPVNTLRELLPLALS